MAKTCGVPGVTSRGKFENGVSDLFTKPYNHVEVIFFQPWHRLNVLNEFVRRFAKSGYLRFVTPQMLYFVCSKRNEKNKLQLFLFGFFHLIEVLSKVHFLQAYYSTMVENVFICNLLSKPIMKVSNFTFLFSSISPNHEIRAFCDLRRQTRNFGKID